MTDTSTSLSSYLKRSDDVNEIFEEDWCFCWIPRTLSHKENSELRSKGIMRACEVAWESACESGGLVQHYLFWGCCFAC